MTTLKQNTYRYLYTVLGVSVELSRWEYSDRLPFFLQDRYEFFQGQLLETLCIFMGDSNTEMESPAVIRKHITQAEKASDLPVVYLRDQVSSYNRKRLIEHKVPFIVPDNQMYLPMLGIDFREHFKSLRTTPKTFRPCAQALLIHILLGRDLQLTSSEAANRLGYSNMSIKRAFDEIRAADIATLKNMGRERCLQVDTSKKELWEKAQSFLRNPVQKRHYILESDAPAIGPTSGLSALAQYSMLAPPSRPVLAYSSENWEKIKQTRHITSVPERDPQATEIEVWRYDPELFAENGLVDRLSLYLSLRESQDERIESALEQMMENVQW